MQSERELASCDFSLSSEVGPGTYLLKCTEDSNWKYKVKIALFKRSNARQWLDDSGIEYMCFNVGIFDIWFFDDEYETISMFYLIFG